MLVAVFLWEFLIFRYVHEKIPDKLGYVNRQDKNTRIVSKLGLLTLTSIFTNLLYLRLSCIRYNIILSMDLRSIYKFTDWPLQSWMLYIYRRLLFALQRKCMPKAKHFVRVSDQKVKQKFWPGINPTPDSMHVLI